LKDDPVLLRKVQRIVAQEARQNGEDEESDDEPSGSGSRQMEGESSIIESGTAATQRGRREGTAAIKEERRIKVRQSEMGPPCATHGEGTQVIPSTQQSIVVDLEDEDDEEDRDEDGDEEMEQIEE
jgi:hypothetical protein